MRLSCMKIDLTLIVIKYFVILIEIGLERTPTVKILLISLLFTFINYLIISTIVNVILMGMLYFHFSLRCRASKFVIRKSNRIDFQKGNKCSAFSSAYLLRHWNIQKSGNDLYEIISNKMKDGCVYPKGMQKLFSQYGFRVKYYTGNINALKNEVNKGNPVIVMIRTYLDKNWLHYVPVVGYDEKYIFIADSLEEFVNCKEQYYNRKIAIKEFKKFWNTSMLKMPFYRNTYIAIYKK